MNTHSDTRWETFDDNLVLRITERGQGRPVLVLHGAAGPASVANVVRGLAEESRVLAPTHPGFDGEPRPEWFDSVEDLAITYLDLLERLDLQDVVVIGFSFGGWIASEMAVRNRTRLGGLVLVDAAGIELEDYDLTNFFARPGNGPRPGGPAPFPALTPEQEATRATNAQTMAIYAHQRGLRDPKLRRRLAHVTLPVLCIWGENDPILPPDYGRAYAQSFPHACFSLIAGAGHLPQREQPAEVQKLLQDFIQRGATQ